MPTKTYTITSKLLNSSLLTTLTPTPLQTSLLLLTLETLLCTLIITKVAYTEIDWLAYMQEVYGYTQGERNYLNLRGDTGPLVYPAGFLYVYRGLKWITDGGRDVRVGQWVFMGLYLVNSWIHSVIAYVLIFKSSSKEASLTSKNIAFLILSLLTVASKRHHSLYVLRLFNDCISSLLLSLSILLLLLPSLFPPQLRNGIRRTVYNWLNLDKPYFASLLFSCSVSIKMSTLLTSPGLLLLLLLTPTKHPYKTAFISLTICFLSQVMFAWPFIQTIANAKAYLRKAFEFDRQFFYEWTVNFRFLDEGVFLSKSLSVGLLLCHVSALVVVGVVLVKHAFSKDQLLIREGKGTRRKVALNPSFVILSMYLTNMIGITFARTVHYQFYAWYFNCLGVLVFWLGCDPLSYTSCLCLKDDKRNNDKDQEDAIKLRNSELISIVKALLMTLPTLLLIEYAYIIYPSTSLSSISLQIGHFLVLSVVGWKWWRGGVPDVWMILEEEEEEEEGEDEEDEVKGESKKFI